MKIRSASSSPAIRLLLIAVALLAAAAGFSQSGSYRGELGPGDTKLGRYFDTYTFQLSAGERMVATLSSYDFDAYLILESPDGREIENDDYSEGSDARIDVLADVRGSWKLKVSSYEEGEEGEYLLIVARERLEELESHAGVLDEQDPVSVKGERFDSYGVFLQRNQRVVISMASDQLDPFLVLESPGGQRMLNDDYQEETESRLDFIAEESGQYQIHATTYTVGEMGEYSLRILLGERLNLQRIDGVLDSADPQLEEFGYFEEHPLSLEEGQHLILEMTSSEFDTVLIVEGPEGYYELNDDYNEQTTISRIELFAPAAGQYRIITAGYDPGAEGGYTLKIYSFGVSGIRLRNTHYLTMIAAP